jgi:predicted aspartyl protease
MENNYQSHPEMLRWQFRTLIAELSHVNLHASDDSCPCHQVGLDPGEYCLGKHLLNIYFLAGETANMDADHRELLEVLAEEALKHHETARTIYCEGGEWPDLAQWSRDWRKKLEPYYYSCRAPKRVKRLAKNRALSDSIRQEGGAMVEQKNKLSHPVYIDITVENPSTGKQESYQALVDTGATFVGLPPAEIEKLGLAVVSENVPILEASEMVFKNIYEARIIYQGRKFPLAVQETSLPVFGVMALEQFQLKINPEKGALEESSPYYLNLL